MIFSTPQATSGAASQPAANSAPPIAGLAAAARLRGTAVKLAAAARSAGVTTAMTKAERVGTSICDNAAAQQQQAERQSAGSGASAAQIRQMIGGMCVNTIVLSRPMRSATQGAASCERGRQQAGPEEEIAGGGEREAEALEQPERQQRIDHQAAGEGVDARTARRAGSTMLRDGPKRGGRRGLLMDLWFGQPAVEQEDRRRPSVP